MLEALIDFLSTPTFIALYTIAVTVALLVAIRRFADGGE